MCSCILLSGTNSLSLLKVLLVVEAISNVTAMLHREQEESNAFIYGGFKSSYYVDVTIVRSFVSDVDL